MKRYAAFLVLRFLTALFFVMTAVYAIAAFSPFAFDHFIKPRVFAPVNQFVALHHLLYLGAYVLIAITLVPDIRRADTRRLAVGYLVVFGIVGEWLFITPQLPKLWNGIECVVAAIGAFAPLVGLAVIDHVAVLRSGAATVGARPVHPPSRALLFACLAAAEYTCLLFLMRGVLRGMTVISSPALFWIACWTLVLHALASVAVYSTLTAVAAVASATRRPGWLEYALLVALVAAAIDAVLLTMILPTISFSEVWAVPVATIGACALAATWSGWALRRPDLDPSAGAVAIVAAPLAPRRRVTALAILVALPPVVFAALNAIEKFDWNALGQKLVVMTLWTIVLSVFVSLMRRTSDAVPRAWSSVLLPPAVALSVALGFGFVSARLHRWSTDPWLHHGAALDRYAAADTSFRILYEWMIEHPGADAQFVRFLQTSTNIPHWAVPASVPPVDLAPTAASSPGRPPHVFWFVIDSLRRDYVSAYNPRATFTPNLGAFARDSLVFDNAFTRYGGTSMAVPSMWAGGLLLHSAYHPPFHPVNALEKLVDAAGYQPLLTLDHIMAPLLTRSTALIEVNRGLDTMKFDMCTTVSDLEEKTERARAGSRPLFAYALIETLHISLVFNRPVPPGDSYPGFYAPVASEARRLDACFGRFIEYLKRSRLYEDSVIVVTADHGDSLGDNGAWGHGVRMAPEVMRVPLIVHVPARLRPRVVTDLGAVALSTDIAPTLYELAGFETRSVGPLFGMPLVAASEARLDRDRRRRPFVVAASYAATYGMLRNNGRLMYVADVVNGREYQFDMGESLLGRQVDVTDDDRRLNRRLIREQVEQLDAFYRYTPKAWNMRSR